MDLGIYPIYAAHTLFGAPKAANYKAHQLENTIDLNGHGSLIYPNFQVGILTGKNINSHLPSEIYADQGTLTLNSIEFIKSAVFRGLDGEETVLPIQPAQHPMLEEAKAFAHILSSKNRLLYEKWLDTAKNVHENLFAMRQDAGIRFEVDDDKKTLS